MANEARATTTAIDFPVVNSNNKLITFLDEAKKSMIPLVPEMYNFVKPELKIGFQRVSVDIEKDAYSVDGGKYSLHLRKLNEIAQAAGLNIIDSKVLDRTIGADGRVTFIKHQVKWQVKTIDGSIKMGTVTGEYSYEEDCARFIYKTDMKDKAGKLWAKRGDKMEAAINKRRNFAGSLAESNAISRAINKGIAKLPQAFTKEELTKPFLVPCVIEDFSDLLKQHPDLEKAYIAQKIGLGAQIQQEGTTHIDPPRESKPDNNTDKDVSEAQVIEETKEEQPKDRPPGVSEKEWNKTLAEQYRDSPQKERTKAINDLIEQKGYKRANPNVSVETYSIDKQIEFIENLMNMPDKTPDQL